LKAVWFVPSSERIREAQAVCRMDEDFHQQLVIAAGNPEMAALHAGVSQRISIIRRLDFTQRNRIDSTYEEHAQILHSIAASEFEETQRLLTGHIDASKAVVRQITLHRLHSARAAHAA
ncbi:MAG: FCD domain-containing protein, partial [Pseudomonadota bacterium]